ncbi:MAG: hypothetical protein FWC13_08130 [Oscillospiraceae bacterium]|nr:hypothetical protein [Oscillospiraceae bacterium]
MDEILLAFISITVVIVVGLLVGYVHIAKRKKQDKLCQNPIESIETKEDKIESVLTSKSSPSLDVMSTVHKMEIENSSGDKLILSNVEKRSSLRKKKYQEITVRGNAIGGGLVQGIMPILGQISTLEKITKIAPNGLFTATAPLSELMKYKDGTIGSIVLGDGKIVSHAGFKETNLGVALNTATIVAAGMQAMAMISGQYYMHNISKQLEGIERGIDKLVGFHHDKNIGKLSSIENVLKGVADKQYVDDTDIIAIQSGVREADSILIEYFSRLERLNKTSAITEIKVRKLLSRLSAAKEMQNLSEKAEEQELFYSFQVCIFASKLKIEGKKAEFAVRMKMGDTTKAVEAFSSYSESHSQSFTSGAHELLDSIYGPINAKANFLLQKQWFKPIQASNTYRAMESKKESLDIFISKMADMNNDEIINNFTKNHDILYVSANADSEQRMFVSVEWLQ